ncbi:zinc finger protein OZF [Parasteatoda tepidariorum]|uniref:zinc finger protein OZF n=1 Tax=Parasteatoda tepidariorum TaxID=114398 RepID=UPI0039BC8B05
MYNIDTVVDAGCRIPYSNYDLYSSSSDPRMCEICGKLQRSLSTLRDHLRVHTQERPFTCEECGRYSHSNSINLGTLHVCNICNKQFATRYYLSRHQVIHTGERPYSCLECDRSFSQKENLQRHMRSHSGMKLFRCIACSSDIQLSASDYTYEDTMLHVCNICNKHFGAKSLLIRHYLKHTGERPYNSFLRRTLFLSVFLNFSTNKSLCVIKMGCSWRRAELSTYGNTLHAFTISVWRLIGEGMHLHSSNAAESSFSSFTDISAIHQCNVCGKIFPHRSGLKMHSLTHTGERPFKCKLCNKSFSQKGNLMRHVRFIHYIALLLKLLDEIANSVIVFNAIKTVIVIFFLGTTAYDRPRLSQ